MARRFDDSVPDALSAEIATATSLHLCYSEPTNFAGAIGLSMGSATLTAGIGNGDFTIANGDVSGRKITVASQTISVLANGTVTHAALVDDANTTLLFVTTTSSQPVITGEAVTTPAFDIETRDPVAP